MESPTYSVVIPHYNRPDLLIRAVNSVLAQTAQDFEILVVDDNSNVPLPTLPGRVRLIHREMNGGGAAARNDGIHAARGRYIAFLDSDDFWLPNRLAEADRIIARADVGARTIYYEDVLIKKRNGPAVVFRNNTGGAHSISSHILCRGLIQTSTLIAPNDGNLFFDDRLRLFQDLDYLVQADKAGYRLTKLSSSNVVWDLVSDSNRLSNKQNIQAAAYFIEKHRVFLPKDALTAFELQHVEYWRSRGWQFLAFAKNIALSNLSWRRKARLILR